MSSPFLLHENYLTEILFEFQSFFRLFLMGKSNVLPDFGKNEDQQF